MNNLLNNNLPAGLEDGSIEIYRHNGVTKALQNGQTMLYVQLSDKIRFKFKAELLNDTKAMKCLKTYFKLSEPQAIEEKFVSCRYGNFDGTADYKDGKLHADAPSCNNEQECEGFGILCLLPEGVNGKLSKQEYFITRLVARGKQNVEICDMLHIQEPTLRTHLSRIREKIVVNNRVEIANWANKKGI